MSPSPQEECGGAFPVESFLGGLERRRWPLYGSGIAGQEEEGWQ
jgi:hypothetical protein